jgi:cytoskeleton protein RodZ
MTSARDDRDGSDGGPGGRLRREREERGLSSQQAAEQLNLDVAVIEALEDNDFPALGAPVFARGHLRRYAALLGIPEGALLAQYEEARPEAPTLVPRAHFERLPERHAPRWPWVAGALVAFAAAGALVAAIGSGAIKWPWTAAAPSEESIGGSQPADRAFVSTTTVTPAPATAPVIAPADQRAVESPAAATAGGATTPGTQTAGAAGALKLDFRFAQDSWIEIFDGTGKAVLYDLGAAGSTRSISAVAPLSVTVGNAPAVALSVNGRSVALPAPEPGQTVVRVTVERSGAVR